MQERMKERNFLILVGTQTFHMGTMRMEKEFRGLLRTSGIKSFSVLEVSQEFFNIKGYPRR
jgi:hypothetical protein